MTSAFPAADGLEVTPEQTQQALADGTAVGIDVREIHEWTAGHIADTRNIGMNDLSEQAPSLPTDTTIVFYCRSGARSAMAAQAFRAAGYDAWSMAGGMLRWADEGRAMEPADGTVAGH